MNLSDTFYVALCMTVLILGVVYWFWTQNQYIQRKLNLLENIVFEMKTQLGNMASVAGPPFIPAGPGNSGFVIPSEMPSNLTPAVYAPAPASVNGDDEDLLHEELHGEASNVEAEDLTPFANNSSPTSATISPQVSTTAVQGGDNDIVVNDNLQPGGVGSGVAEQVSPDNASRGSMLDGMTLKELRRLAEQRSINNASSMRKQALIDALRALPDDIKPYDGDAQRDLN